MACEEFRGHFGDYFGFHFYFVLKLLLYFLVDFIFDSFKFPLCFQSFLLFLLQSLFFLRSLFSSFLIFVILLKDRIVIHNFPIFTHWSRSIVDKSIIYYNTLLIEIITFYILVMNTYFSPVDHQHYSLKVSPEQKSLKNEGRGMEWSQIYQNNARKCNNSSLHQLDYANSRKNIDRYRYRDINCYGDRNPYTSTQTNQSFTYGKQNLEIKYDILERYKNTSTITQRNKEAIEKYQVASEVNKIREKYKQNPSIVEDRLIKHYSEYMTPNKQQSLVPESIKDKSIEQLYQPNFMNIKQEVARVKKQERDEREIERIWDRLGYIDRHVRREIKKSRRRLRKLDEKKKTSVQKKERDYKQCHCLHRSECKDIKVGTPEHKKKYPQKQHKNDRQHIRKPSNKKRTSNLKYFLSEPNSPKKQSTKNSGEVRYYPYHEAPIDRGQFLHRELRTNYHRLQNLTNS